jgi:hypothetical protein
MVVRSMLVQKAEYIWSDGQEGMPNKVRDGAWTVSCLPHRDTGGLTPHPRCMPNRAAGHALQRAALQDQDL